VYIYIHTYLNYVPALAGGDAPQGRAEVRHKYVYIYIYIYVYLYLYYMKDISSPLPQIEERDPREVESRPDRWPFLTGGNASQGRPEVRRYHRGRHAGSRRRRVGRRQRHARRLRRRYVYIYIYICLYIYLYIYAYMYVCI